MTAVASPPSLPQIPRLAWGTCSGNNSMDADEARGMFAPPRKQLSRRSSGSSNSSTKSISSNGSRSNGTSLTDVSDLSHRSTSIGSRKRSKGPWLSGKQESQTENSKVPHNRANGILTPQSGMQPIAVQNHVMQQQQQQQQQQRQQHTTRGSAGGEQPPPVQPVLYLLSLNGTFERKTITVPYAPDSLKVGRQTNPKTVPTPTNGYFDSKVLSRQHAEIHAERNGKIFIRDVKSSNGTFVNGSRLSQENRESDPHELQTADHLELGIDIVSEDQKTVVHHKVAARVEHAGFPSATSNVLDMTFGDLDPANGTMMMPNGPLQMRGRPSANVAMGNNGGRFMGGNGPLNGQVNVLPPQRSFLLAPIATDIILKRLTTEMRNARLQAQDLGRTNHFVHTLLSKADVKDVEKLEMPEPGRSKPQRQPSINGRLPFRSDAAKARFSEPPAPPPQQPLPEKPDVSSLRRGSTDRLKSGLANAGPTRHESLTQIVQLTEALKKSKRVMDSQTARMRELEDMLKREREAREIAEDLAKRLEATAQVQTNGSVAPMGYDSSIAVHYEPEKDAGVEDMELEELVPDPQGGHVETSINHMEASLQARIDNLDEQMRTMRDQLQHLKDRCESAELERDESQKSLAEMVVQLRAEEAKRIAAENLQQSELQSRSILSSPSQSQDQAQSLSHRRDETNRTDKVGDTAAPASAEQCMRPSKDLDESILAKGDADDIPTLSRANTITPLSSRKGLSLHQESLEASLPYASMIGVVLIGMGLMAYINGWQSPSPSRIEP